MQSTGFIGMLCCCIIQLGLMQVCAQTTGANIIVGNKTRTKSGRFRREVGILMNFGAPSPQTGVVTSWNFYYNCAIPRFFRYHATFMMYRLNATTSQYQVLPESIQSISVECMNAGVTLRGNRTLMVEEQFQVEEGDIVAICLPNDGRVPLRIASMLNANRDRASNIREFSVNQGEGCSTEQLQTISFQDLDLRQDLLLHLYAEAITVPETMTIAEDPSDVTSSPTTQAETVSHVSPTSTTNTIVIASDSGFDQSPDLVIIKIITISLSMAVMAIVMTTVVVLVTVVAMMWRRRRVNNSASTTMVEIESQNNANAEFNMTDNVSYNICDTDVLSHHYEYPDLSMTVLDESNIYDSIDS